MFLPELAHKPLTMLQPGQEKMNQFNLTKVIIIYNDLKGHCFKKNTAS